MTLKKNIDRSRQQDYDLIETIRKLKDRQLDNEFLKYWVNSSSLQQKRRFGSKLEEMGRQQNVLFNHFLMN